MNRPRSIRAQILEETGNEIVADWYLDVVIYFVDKLEDYHNEEIETIRDMMRGFITAIENLDENGSDELTPDMDEAYHIFLGVFVRLPCFSSVPKYILALTLDQFFLENFLYLPPSPEIVLSSPSDTSSDVGSLPSSASIGRSSSTDSGLDTQDN